MRRFFIFVVLGLTMMCCQCRVKKAVSGNSDVAEPVVQYQVIQGDTLEYVDSTCYAISKDRFIYRGDTLVKSVHMTVKGKKSIQCMCSSYESTKDSLEKSGYDLVGMERYHSGCFGSTLTDESFMKIGMSPEGTLLSLFQGWVSEEVYQLVADGSPDSFYITMIIDLRTMQIIEYGFRIHAQADIYDVISLWEIKNILDGIREFEICFKTYPYNSKGKLIYYWIKFGISFKGKVIIQ